MADEEPLSVLELEENLSDIEKPPILPAGSYIGEVQDVQIATSQRGNSYYAIRFNVSQDQVPADMQDSFEDGAVLFYNRVIVPQGRDRRALYNLRRLIEALGLDSNVTAIDPNDWMGCKAKLRVTNTKYNGEDQANIQSIEAATEVKAKAAAPVKRGRK